MAAPHRVSFAAAHQPSKSAGRPGGIRTPSIRFWRPALYQLELLACTWVNSTILAYRGLFCLPMHRVMPAAAAKFLRLQPFGLLLFVLCRRIVAFFAVVALQRDNVPHFLSVGLAPRPFPLSFSSLRDDFRYCSSSDGATTLADGESQSLLQGHRLDQFDRQADVVSRHHHFRAFRQFRRAGHIRRPEVK